MPASSEVRENVVIDLNRISIGFAALLLLSALLSLIGWQFDISVFITPLPGVLAINPTTTVLFIVTAVTIFTIRVKNKNATTKTAIGVFALFIIAIAVLKLSMFVTGYDTGIDRILFPNKLNDANGFTYHQMAPNAAFNFLLLGVSLILLLSTASLARRMANYLTLITLTISLFSLIGYLYKARQLYALGNYVPMSFAATICFMLASIAMLCYNYQYGLMRTITSPYVGGKIARIILPAIVLLPILGGYLRFATRVVEPVTSELGISILITFIIVMLFIIVWFLAVELNNTDEERTEAEKKNVEFNRKLEEKIKERTAQIRKNEGRFSAVIENSYEAIYMLDHSLEIIYRSPAAVRLLGWTNEDRHQRGVLEHLHPDDIREANQAFAQCLANPIKPVSVVIRSLHKSGHYVWLEGVLTNLLNDPGVSAIIANVRDITERKQAEEKLLAANRVYAFTSQINQAIVRVTDREHLFREVCNIAIEHGKFKSAWVGLYDELAQKINLVAHSGEPVIDLNHYRSIDCQNPAVIASPLGVMLATGKYDFSNDIKTDPRMAPWHQDAEFNKYNSCVVLPLRLAGKVMGAFYISSAAEGIFDDDELVALDEAAGDISFALDVFAKEEQRRVAEEKLRINERRLNQAQQIGHIGSWHRKVINNEIIWEWSEEAYRILGYEPGSIKPSLDTFLELVHPEDAKILNDYMDNLEEVPTEAAFSFRLMRPDKSIRHTYVESKFEFDNNRVPVLAYGIIHDITEQKLAEQEILKLNTELENRVEERTSQLQEAIEQLRTFSYSVSHDLRSPLRTMNSYAKLFLEDYGSKLEPGAIELIEVIQKASREMEALITDLLAFAGLDKKKVEEVVIDMNLLVQEVLEKMNESEQLKAKVKVQELPFVKGDISMIKQCLINLLSNAVKYSSRKDKPVVEIGTIKVEGETTFYIKDNGIGFDMMYAEKIFEVFQRLHGKSEFEGTGVGLAIVKRIVDKHHGRVWAVAEPNQGATFYFTLPLAVLQETH